VIAILLLLRKPRTRAASFILDESERGVRYLFDLISEFISEA